MLDGEQFSDEGLTDDGWTNIYYLKSRFETCSQPKCISSQTRFLRRPSCVGSNQCFYMFEKKAEHDMISDSCKNGSDIAGETI